MANAPRNTANDNSSMLTIGGVILAIIAVVALIVVFSGGDEEETEDGDNTAATQEVVVTEAPAAATEAAAPAAATEAAAAATEEAAAPAAATEAAAAATEEAAAPAAATEAAAAATEEAAAPAAATEEAAPAAATEEAAAPAAATEEAAVAAATEVVEVAAVPATEEAAPAAATEEAAAPAAATEEAAPAAATEEAAAMATEAPVAAAATEEAAPAAATEAAAASDGTIDTVCLVTDIGRINDGTFNQYAYEGMIQAAEEFGLESIYIETTAPTDYEANIGTCLSEGYDIIVTVGFLLADATSAAAAANPDVYFIGVDQFQIDGPTNYVGIQFREDQAGFLVGVLAGLVTESNTVAGVYGIDIPPVVKFRNGFEQGVAYIAAEEGKEVATLGVYIDNFNAPDRGASAAEQFMGEGADVIFGAGGPTGSGGILAAAQQNVYVIGVDQDEYFTTFGGGETPGVEFLISSALKRVNVGVYDMIKTLVNGDMAAFNGGGLYVLSVENGGIDFAEKHDSNVDDAIYERVSAVRDMLASGELETGVDPATGELLNGASAPEAEATEAPAAATEEAAPAATEAVEAEATAEATPGQ